MRKSSMLVIPFIMMTITSNATFIKLKKGETENKNFSVFEKKAVAKFFLELSRKDYEDLTGRHLGLGERLAFKMAQKKVKKELQEAGQSNDADALGGFILGFILGLIGVLLVYLFSANSTVKKWTWIGFGAILLIVLIAVLASA